MVIIKTHNMKYTKVFSGKGRKVIKRLSVDEKIIALRVQLGESRKEAIRSLNWLNLKIKCYEIA